MANNSPPTCSDVPFVSRSLAIEWVPAAAAPPLALWVRCTDGRDRPYFKFTPEVMAWLSTACDELDARVLAGEVKREAAQVVADRLAILLDYANAHFGVEDVRRAAREGAGLPLDPRWGPNDLPDLGLFSDPPRAAKLSQGPTEGGKAA
jgi:hypothetical protein